MRVALGDLMGCSLQVGSSCEDLRIVLIKIALIGSWCWGFYQKAFADALEAKGVLVIKPQIHQKPLLFLDIQTYVLNYKIIFREVRNEKSDLIMFWRPVHVRW